MMYVHYSILLSGNWSTGLRKIIHQCYEAFGYDPATYVVPEPEEENRDRSAPDPNFNEDESVDPEPNSQRQEMPYAELSQMTVPTPGRSQPTTPRSALQPHSPGRSPDPRHSTPVRGHTKKRAQFDPYNYTPLAIRRPRRH